MYTDIKATRIMKGDLVQWQKTSEKSTLKYLPWWSLYSSLHIYIIYFLYILNSCGILKCNEFINKWITYLLTYIY